MEIKKKLANKSNYGGKRIRPILYIVIHYTANDGDHDESNGNYFANNIVKASAHYFVDDDSATLSVPEDYVAYAVGGNYGGGKYYGTCTNANSISIELCDAVKDGKVYPTEATIKNAIELTKSLMKKYNVPADKVIRHYDVNGKKCPLYWVDDKKWKAEFHDKLTSVEEVKVETKTVKATYTGTLPAVTLKKGDSGKEVKYLQKFLNWYGDYKLTVDGDFGTKTLNAVKDFQKNEGLTVDGVFGKNSLSKAKTTIKK